MTTIKLDNLLIESHKHTYDELREYLNHLRTTHVKGMDAIVFEDFADYVLNLKALADEVADIKRKENE